jgi:processive 1,2-diacylglycerol beta-glucosyltransferase
MSRRILILSASAGAGHLRAAEAVETACRSLDPAAEVRNVDVLSLTTAPFRRVYGKGYLDFVNKAPELLGILYDRTNQPPSNPATDRLRLLVERMNTRPLVQLLREFAPDVICHTHFLPAEIVAHQKRKRKLAVPHVVVVTDYDVHRFWLCPGVERYFVAREDNRVHLEALGEPAESILVTGIPIHPSFGGRFDREQLKAKHQLGALPLVLVSGGGFGVGPVESLLQSLAESVTGAQILVIAGRNAELRVRLEKLAAGSRTPIRVIGFTTEMHELMAVADLMVSKPGGLTTSEALALGLPLVVANAIPGQETRNATMLFESGVAISGENPLTVGHRVAKLLSEPERLQAMRAAARRLAKPRAAHDVAREVLGLGRGSK